MIVLLNIFQHVLPCKTCPLPDPSIGFLPLDNNKPKAMTKAVKAIKVRLRKGT